MHLGSESKFLFSLLLMCVQLFKYNEVCAPKEGPSLQPFRIIPRRAVNVAMISLVSSIRGKEGWERGGGKSLTKSDKAGMFVSAALVNVAGGPSLAGLMP